MNPAVIQQIKSMMSAVQAAQNPVTALNQMMASNPQLQAALTLIQQNGGDARAAFFAYAKQNGIDPQQVLNALRQ